MKQTIIAICALLLSGCSKVIDINYESLDDLYVVQATLSSSGAEVLITATTDMDEPLQTDPITSATVTISSSQGEQHPLLINDHGLYEPTAPIEVTQGDDYTLSIEIDQEIFTATAHLYPTPIISDVSFSQQLFTEDMNLVFCTFSIQNTPDQVSYYRYRFRYIANEDEEDPSWSLAKSEESGEDLLLMTHLYTPDRDLIDGDIITIDVQAIDRSVYEYFYSLNLSGNSSTNPITNFTGNCLGFFSAYSLTSLETPFFYANCE